LVNGLIPSRAGRAGFVTTTNFAKPWSTKILPRFHGHPQRREDARGVFDGGIRPVDRVLTFDRTVA
jgi:hypothetical protein